MECPNCGVFWAGVRTHVSTTMTPGRCSSCGAIYVVDHVQVMKEAKKLMDKRLQENRPEFTKGEE
jgi:uncharacterized Zn finger protein